MPKHPLNILLLMADQWRWDTIFQAGHVCQTPNLDLFVESAVAFRNAFTNVPLCSPARGSLLTGLWPHQIGLMDNVQGGSFYPNGQLHTNHKTYLERLSDNLDYTVHYAGKWHIGRGTAAERGIDADISDGAAPARRGEGLPMPEIKGDALPPFYASYENGKNRDPLKRKPHNPDGFVNLRDLFPTLISLAGAESILSESERNRSYWQTNHEAAFYTYDAYQGRQFKLRGIRTLRYKYNWSPNDLCELYDLENDPGERVNLIDNPAFAEVRTGLNRHLMAWMAKEDDYLLHISHLLPVGSYIDGRDFEQQHDPGVWSEEEKCWFGVNMDA